MSEAEMRALSLWTAKDHAEMRSRYPRLFAEPAPGYTWNYGHRFECGRGWRALIEPVFEIAESLPTLRVRQIKEKYGALKMYFDGDGSPELGSAIRFACLASEITCEACGNMGKLARTRRDWFVTVCEDHLPDDAAFVVD